MRIGISLALPRSSKPHGFLLTMSRIILTTTSERFHAKYVLSAISQLRRNKRCALDVVHKSQNTCLPLRLTIRFITGAVVPDMEAKLALVADAHYKLMPDVPLVGWDVALTTQGVCLLEVNLSCNFFRGSFELDKYVNFIHDYFVALEEDRGHAKAD